MMIDLEKARHKLKVSKSTIYRYGYTSRLKYRRIAGQLFVFESELRHLVRPKVGRPKKNFPAREVN